MSFFHQRTGFALLAASLLTSSAYAQQVKDVAYSLPNSPGAVLQQTQDAAAAPVAGQAAINGIVRDVSGALVPGARVTLVGPDGRDVSVIESEPTGGFVFNGLARGPFRVTVTAKGLEPYVSPEISLRPNETRTLTNISLSVATEVTSVSVSMSIEQLATAEVKIEEHQRAFGILPNFYTSYIYDAAPLSAKNKYSLAFHSALDPVEFAGAAFGALLEQGLDTYHDYHQGLKGYGRRYGARYADQFSARIIGSAILPSLLHEDPRYFYQGSGTKKQRALHAVYLAFFTRTDKGRYEPNYSYLGGALASGAIANLYLPDANRGIAQVFQTGGVAIGGHIANNLIREFLLKKITPNIPATSNGKPADVPSKP